MSSTIYGNNFDGRANGDGNKGAVLSLLLLSLLAAMATLIIIDQFSFASILYIFFYSMFIVVVAVAFAAASCFGDADYTRSYNLYQISLIAIFFSLCV